MVSRLEQMAAEDPRLDELRATYDEWYEKEGRDLGISKDEGLIPFFSGYAAGMQRLAGSYRFHGVISKL
jgi:hypothetical protein